MRSYRIIAVALLALSVGCDRDITDNQAPQLVADVSSPGGEEELFGEVWQNGAKTTSTGFYASLVPFNAATAARLRLHLPSDETIWVNPNAGSAQSVSGHMYGWFDPVVGGGCGSLAAYLQSDLNARQTELHPPGPGQAPQGKERHCLRPGIYNFSVADKLFRLDYLQPATNGGSFVLINNTTAGQNEYVEAIGYSEQQASNWLDLVVHVDRTPGSYPETRVLDVDNTLLNPTASTFTNSPSPAGTENDYFRFSAARSATNWNLSPQGRALARLYWDFDRNKAISTNYYDHRSTGALIRHHTFHDHVAESRNVVVALELMRPDEPPDDTLNVATRTIQITRTTPFACASFEATTTWRYTDQVLNAACSTRGSSIQYRWQFFSGGPWTAYSSDTLYSAFLGHNAAGAYDVSVEARNTSSGLSSSQTYPFSVTSGQIVLSGPTYITQKTTYLYTSNTSALWYERFDHDTQWWPATSEPRTWMNRLWYAGDYSVSLRQAKVQSGSLGRGRLEVTVCNPCGGPAIMASPAATPVPELPWGIFGAGPWLSWGADSAVRLYDLLGAHDLTTRFADVSWLDDNDGRALTGLGAALFWSRRILPSPDTDVRAFDFTVTTSTPVITFGFAADPDLGRNAADDAAGYDALRHMAYVWDADRALGFLIRGPGGGNILRSVTQFGVSRRSPVTTREAWSAQRESSVRLLPGQSDVQFLLTTPGRSGPATWTVVIVRGANLVELQARADAVIAQLN